METKVMWSEIVENFTKFVVEESRKFINIGITCQKDGVSANRNESSLKHKVQAWSLGGHLKEFQAR